MDFGLNIQRERGTDERGCTSGRLLHTVKKENSIRVVDRRGSVLQSRLFCSFLFKKGSGAAAASQDLGMYTKRLFFNPPTTHPPPIPFPPRTRPYHSVLSLVILFPVVLGGRRGRRDVDVGVARVIKVLVPNHDEVAFGWSGVGLGWGW